MPNPKIAEAGEQTRWKPGQSGNPAGKPKGSKHISTWIQELLNDEDFTLDNFMGQGKAFKGAPIAAIMAVAVSNALQGDHKWAEWLAKYGYGQKYEVDQNVSGDVTGTFDIAQAKKFAEWLQTDTKN